jgi:hypothetical protein
LTWKFDNGADGKFYLVESIGGGVAFIDYNNDGLLDIFAVQSGRAPGYKDYDRSVATRNVLYRNNGDGTFTDVTAQSGLDMPTGYGQGVSVADFDNDGWPDLYITGYGGNHLFRNNRDGTFTDVTRQAGVSDLTLATAPSEPAWSTSSAWADYDNDGFLDLFVCHYCQWSATVDDSRPVRTDYSAPYGYPPSTCRLYHNNGNGTFTDVSAQAGLNRVFGKSLSAAWIDYDDDGWMDVFVTNDTMPNVLLHNNRDGTFTDKAVAAGVAYNASGQPSAGMGIGVCDYLNEGRPDIFVVNFSHELKSVKHNLGHGVFEDAVQSTGIAATNLNYLGFGLECLDYDLDGRPDVVIGNGHVFTNIHDYDPYGGTYAQSQQLFHNEGHGKFVQDDHSLGDLANPRVTRGLAVGDFDNDGDVDIVMVSQTGPLQLYRNDGGNANHWVTFRLEGVKSNRDAVGARVRVRTKRGTQTQWVKGGSSYCSHSDLRLTFGLGDEASVESVEVRWPSGLRQSFAGVAANHFYRFIEGHAPEIDVRCEPRGTHRQPR